MSTGKTPTEAKLLVWRHLQVITQAGGCFWNHLTLTSRTWAEPNQDSLLSAQLVAHPSASLSWALGVRILI